jgi:thioredoxin 1
MAGKNVHVVNDVNFDQEVLEADTPVLVDFTATWCGPCRQIAPLIDQIADEYDGRVKVTKLDIDDSPATAQKFGIRGVPTLYVFKGGQVVAQQVGAVPKAVMQQLVERAL